VLPAAALHCALSALQLLHLAAAAGGLAPVLVGVLLQQQLLLLLLLLGLESLVLHVLL
jgi:hypothetical protein